MVTPSAGTVILVRFPSRTFRSRSCGQPSFWSTPTEVIGSYVRSQANRTATLVRFRSPTLTLASAVYVW